MYTLDFNTGILISPITTFRYSVQYTENGCLSYLFDNRHEVFCVEDKSRGGGTFSVAGELLIGERNPGVVAIAPQAWEFITNYENGSWN